MIISFLPFEIVAAKYKINTCKRPLLPYLANDPLLIKIHIKLQIEMQMMGLQSNFA